MGLMDSQPVTRAELLEALDTQKKDLIEALVGQKQDLFEALAVQKQEILDVVHGQLAAQSERTQEIVRDAQTEILKAFLPAHESNNIRLCKIEANLSNTDAGLSERMAVLERRLGEIEKRLLMNPPAA